MPYVQEDKQGGISILHNLERDGKMIKGCVNETRFHGYIMQGDGTIHVSDFGNYEIHSNYGVGLEDFILYVHGLGIDIEEPVYLECEYGTEEEAQSMLDYINTFTYANKI